MPFKDLDLFPKLQKEVNRQSNTTGTITLFCFLLMGFCFITLSISYFFHGEKQRLIVDESPLPTDENNYVIFEKLPKLDIHFDILFPNLPCPFLDFGVIDSFKEQQLDQFSDIKVKRLDKRGEKIKNKNLTQPVSTGCGSCYGQSSGCCNTCKDVRRAYKAKGIVPPPLATIPQCQPALQNYEAIKDEQCHIYGTLIAPPSHGIFYIAPGDSYFEKTKQTEDYLAMGLTVDDFNLTHLISYIYFGPHDSDKLLRKHYVRQENYGRMKGMYYFSVIKEFLPHSDKIEYHSTVTTYQRYREGDSGKFPGLFFNYDVSPLIIQHKRDNSVLRFLSNLIGILGGIYSLGVLLDRLLVGSALSETTSL